MEPNYIKPIILYDLFFTKSISNTTLPEKKPIQPQPIMPSTPVKSKKRTLADYSLNELEQLISPNGKKILKTVRKEEQLELARALVEDADLVEANEMEEYENDPDYKEKMENNGLGFYMENFIAFHGVCPVCGQKTLRKYSFSNMPVIDLICVNVPYHTVHGGCFLYQVKTSLNDMYFSRKSNRIMIGSKRFGYNSHAVKGTDSDIKKLLTIGYICLFMDLQTDNTKYKINKLKSFVLIPDLQKKLDQYYYEYKGEFMGKISLVGIPVWLG